MSAEIEVIEVIVAGRPGATGIQWRNIDWTIGQIYYQRDGILHDSSSWRVIADHTASALNEPGIGADWEDFWELIAAGGTLTEEAQQASQAAIDANEDAQSAAALAGSYDTLSAATAALASYTEGQSVEVTADDANNGRWAKRSGAWVQISDMTLNSEVTTRRSLIDEYPSLDDTASQVTTATDADGRLRKIADIVDGEHRFDTVGTFDGNLFRDYDSLDPDLASVETALDADGLSRVLSKRTLDGQQTKEYRTNGGNSIGDYESIGLLSMDTATDEDGNLIIVSRTANDGAREAKEFRTNGGNGVGDYESIDLIGSVNSAPDDNGILRILSRETNDGKQVADSFRTNAGHEFGGVYDTLDQAVTVETALDADGVERQTDRVSNDGDHIAQAFETFGKDKFSHYDTTDIDFVVFRTAKVNGTNRIVSGLDVDGFERIPGRVLPSVEGIENLRMTPARIRQILNGTAAQYVVNFISDSYGYARTWSAGMMRTSLASLIGDAGPGYIDFTNALEASSPTLLTSVNAYTSDYTCVLTGAWAQTVYTSPSPAGGHQSTTAAGEVTITGPATPVLSAVNLHYIKTANGQARYRWNAGSWTTLDLTTGANTGLNQIALSGMPGSGAWTLEIEWVFGTVTLNGLDMRSAVAGVRLNKLAKNGQQARHVATVNAAQWQQGQGALSPDLIFIMFGTNDQALANITQFAVDMATVASRAKLAAPNADIIVAVPAENFVPLRSVKLRHMANAVRRSVRGLGVCFIDLQQAFGENPVDYGSSGRVFFNEGSDPYHPTTLGHAAITAAILKLITP